MSQSGIGLITLIARLLLLFCAQHVSKSFHVANCQRNAKRRLLHICRCGLVQSAAAGALRSCAVPTVGKATSGHTVLPCTVLLSRDNITVRQCGAFILLHTFMTDVLV